MTLKGKGTSTGTSTRAIRIPKDLDRILQQEAKRRNISINGLISSVLTKFSEWDRYAEGFGLAGVPIHILKRLALLVDEDLIAKTGSELGPELLRSEVIFWFKEATLETFLDWFALFSKYSGLIDGSITKTDGAYVIVVRHEMGRKGSVFLKNYFESAFKTGLGIAPETEISEFQVSLRLHNTRIASRETLAS
jgi:hypothetical protein